MNKTNASKKLLVKFCGFISIAGIFVISLLLLGGIFKLSALRLWWLFSILIILLLISIGHAANGKWYGFLIDTRNRTSLSRLQISLWTILAVSAYLAISLSRGIPNAMTKPTTEELEQCRANYLRTVEGIADIETFRSKDRDAAADALARANDHCSSEPLRITFPPELLLALGISTASFAGSTLVQSMKRNKSTLGLITEAKKKMDEDEKTAKEKEEAYNQIQKKYADVNLTKDLAELRKATPGRPEADQLKDQSEVDKAVMQIKNLAPLYEQAKTDYETAKTKWEKTRAAWETEDRKKEGVLKVNESPQQANLVDLFQGDEIGNYQLIDLSKVQMFLITIAIILSYGVALGGLLGNQAAVLHSFGVGLPAFSATLNTLLGISHAGYLGVKSVSHTKTD
jgi:hypothetical protein